MRAPAPPPLSTPRLPHTRRRAHSCAHVQLVCTDHSCAITGLVRLSWLCLGAQFQSCWFYVRPCLFVMGSFWGFPVVCPRFPLKPPPPRPVCPLVWVLSLHLFECFVQNKILSEVVIGRVSEIETLFRNVPGDYSPPLNTLVAMALLRPRCPRKELAPIRVDLEAIQHWPLSRLPLPEAHPVKVPYSPHRTPSKSHVPEGHVAPWGLSDVPATQVDVPAHHPQPSTPVHARQPELTTRHTHNRGRRGDTKEHVRKTWQGKARQGKCR